jgi:hypothetical protein
MTTYLVTGVRTIRLEADDCTTRQDGSLWLLRALRPKPAALEPVLILARGQWESVMVEGANILFIGEPQPASASADKPTPRFA